MPFPLVEGAVSADGLTVITDDTLMAPGQTGLVDWTESFGLYPAQVRSGSVTRSDVETMTLGSITATRGWGGIGVTILGANQGWTVVT